MACIKQAAKWMKEGKTVRRASLPYWELRFIRGTHDLDFLSAVDSKYTTELTAQDLCSEDWEIAE